MSKPLVFKILNPGFSLRRATCELGDFRVWHSEEIWWWSLNDAETSYGSEETLSDAMGACQKYYDTTMNKNAREAFMSELRSIPQENMQELWPNFLVN